MSLNKDQITAALRKLGPSAIGTLADHLEVERSALQYHLKGMPDLKYAGNRLNRVVALPDQKIDDSGDTPPQKRQAKARKGHRAKKRDAPTPPARPAAAPAFIPAFTSDDRLVIVQGAEPAQIYSPEQTEGIATLLANYFKA